MKLTASRPSLDDLHSDLIALGVFKGPSLSALGRELDKRLGGLLTKRMKKEKFAEKEGEARLLDTHGEIPADTILLIGLGEEGHLSGESLRKAAAKAIRTGNKIRARKISLEDIFTKKKNPAPEERGQLFAEGALLGSYRFDRYKSQNSNDEDQKPTVTEFEILSSDPNRTEKGMHKGAVFAEATNFARDLVNVPASDLTPKRIAEEAKKIGRMPHLSITVYGKSEIEKMGMGCYLAVARGSTESPYFIHLRYRPPSRRRSQKRIALVGKGVTFDSGGLSLKTAQSMETMKDDMSGAAAMLAVMRALSILKPPVEVHGISPLTENMPSGSADKPGDVARAMNGKTVEILNTDAEGRLTLADALPYALKQKPDLVVDVATLTGACVIALGELCSGILGNNEKLIRTLIECGQVAGERIWQLPLVEEYKEELKSSIADLKNVGGRWGGTINGALFLREFVDSKVPWAHIDIAGPSWTEKDLDYCPRGGTGHIVRTLLHFLLQN